VRDYGFLLEFVQSPYAFSLSFLKDPNLVGKQDDLGINKYNINLDEELVEKFFEIIKDQELKNQEADGENYNDQTSIVELFN
jgi:hypothetical protein